MTTSLFFSEPRISLIYRGIQLHGVLVDNDGRIFMGHIHADPDRPEVMTAFFSFGLGEYKVSPEDDYPGRSRNADTLSRVIDIAKDWIASARPPARAFATWTGTGALHELTDTHPHHTRDGHLVDALDDTGYRVLPEHLKTSGSRDTYHSARAFDTATAAEDRTRT